MGKLAASGTNASKIQYKTRDSKTSTKPNQQLFHLPLFGVVIQIKMTLTLRPLPYVVRTPQPTTGFVVAPAPTKMNMNYCVSTNEAAINDNNYVDDNLFANDNLYASDNLRLKQFEKQASGRSRQGQKRTSHLSYSKKR